MRPFGSSLASGSIGTPKLSEFAREQSHDGNKTMRAWSGPKADNILLRQSRARDVVGAQAVTSHIAQGSGSCKLCITRHFWELTGFGFHRNSEVKRVRTRAYRAFPGWVTHWEVLVNKTMRAWSWPKKDNIMPRRSRARDVVGALAGM
ncbi:hypothetical protein DVH24_006956 [Malus domestica]|uniref:Uncharacterized protein n=1 Tax=Malus domestica TaxID=3750 RepID=A0A498I5V1_MALDO|nr:hypothetical protein DVH24_006956 [Malus domestica]